VDFIARESALLAVGFLLSCRPSGELSEWVKALKFQPAVIAQQFSEAGDLQNDRSIIIATLHACALASGAPHRGLSQRLLVDTLLKSYGKLPTEFDILCE
jgi:hypothetical protein